MANYNLVVSSKFQPFSFERYIKPYQMYGEAYKELENAYDTLAMQSEDLRMRAAAEPNSEWAQRYTQYADMLQSQADNLIKEGLNTSNRSALSKLKRDYSTNIVPIKSAIARQAELVKYAASQNPALRMVYGDMPTIDQLISNPNLTQVGYSGSDVEKSAMQLAAAAATRQHSDSFGNFTKYWMRHRETTGFSKADINKFLQDASNIPELQGIIGQVQQQFGNFEGLSDAQKQKMAGEIMSGILKGATYQDKSTYQQDPVALKYLDNEFTRNRSNQNPDNTIGFSPRIIEGAEGETTETANRLKGLRASESGKNFTTDALHEKTIKLREAAKKVQQYKEIIDKQNQNNSPTYSWSGQQTTAKAGRDYIEYQKALTAYNKAKQEYNDEQNYLKSLTDKYSHLGRTQYEKVLIGSTLEQLQSKQNLSSFVLNAANSRYDNVRAGIANIISSFTEDQLNSGNVGIIDSNGKALDYDDVQSMLNDKDNKIRVKIKGGVKPKLTLVYKGKEYSTKGVQQIDQYNKELQTMQNYLTDFSKDAVNDAPIVDSESMNLLLGNQIGKIDLTKNKSTKVDDQHRSVVFYEPNSQNYIKILTDNQGRILAKNTLYDELQGGQNRDQYFINMANRGLQSIIPLTTGE